MIKKINLTATIWEEEGCRFVDWWKGWLFRRLQSDFRGF